MLWWTGLTKKEVNGAIALAGPRSIPGRVASRTTAHLLPPFDEYTVAYKDRTSILDPAFAKRLNKGGGILNAVVVVNGLVTGTWKRVLRGKSVDSAISLFHELPASEIRAVEHAAARYGAFLGRDVVARSA